MTFDRANYPGWLAAAFGALLAAGLGWVLRDFTLGRGLITTSYDLLLVARGDLPVREAVIVYLDEAAFGALQQRLNVPWDRALHARLIDRLTHAGARAIVFDIVFTDPMPNRPEADEAMARAMKSNGRTVLGLDVIKFGASDRQGVPLFEMIETNAASIGSVELLADSDLVVRRLHSFDERLGLPSLSGAAAGLLGVRADRNEVLRFDRAWMNYYGAPSLLPSVSYHEALDSLRVKDEFFRGKTVFVGARLMTKFANERKDEYVHPYSQWIASDESRQATVFVPGVEIQATAFLNLVRGDWLTRWPAAAERGAILGLGLLFGFGLVRLRPVMATVVGLGATGLVAALSYLLFRDQHVWFPWLIIVVLILVALAWSILFNSVRFYVRQQLYQQTLGLYLSPKLVKKFSSNPQLLKPGAVEHTLTIFFSDIVNFTNISQRISSDALAKVMNAYFQTAVSECIHRTDGTVVKYIGDAIFAFWNAPDAQTDHALRACEAALRFRNCRILTPSGEPLRTRIGIHTGEARVGNFGSLDRVDYTALGESVNLASRLEGLNKYLGTDCLITLATREGLGDRLVTRAVGQFQLKGFDDAVEVFEMVGWAEEAEATQPWREAFAGALNNYRQRNLEFAAAGFQHVLKLRPDDGPSKFYLERLKELSLQPLPDDWTGFTQFKEK
jgi:adenylate cyclase